MKHRALWPALAAALALIWAAPLTAQSTSAPPPAAEAAPPAALGQTLSPDLERAEAAPPPASSYFTGKEASEVDIFKAVGAFAIVMALLYGSLKLLRRLGSFRGPKGRSSIIELRGIQPLDSRKYLAAVEVEGRLIVLGVTPDRISPLAHWALDDSLDFSPSPPQEPENAFSLDKNSEDGPHFLDAAGQLAEERK